MLNRGVFKSRWVRILAAVLLSIVVLGVALVLVVSISPSTAAYGSDALRKVIGNQAVAVLEEFVFKVKDNVTHLEYNIGLDKPASPWADANADILPIKTTTARYATESLLPPTHTPTSNFTPTPQLGTPVPTLTPTITPTEPWSPPEVTPMGTLPEVGIWEPYISDANGHVLAYRTFIQPDPDRPYAVTAVVAFDLDHIRLHYVIGFQEPYDPHIHDYQPGKIPDGDKLPGVLLAAFNGGFKFQHGKFGSMQDNFVSVKPRDGLGTVAIYKDGHVVIGEWGTDIVDTPDLVAYRQNGPLIIHDGEVSKLLDDPDNWGYTLTGQTVTWRSGLAISQDGKTLYYFAGPYLNIQTLAKAMLTVNPQQAMQLDINNFWVHFIALRTQGDYLQSEALFPKDMKDQLSRYLGPYSRDYFYVTSAEAASMTTAVP